MKTWWLGVRPFSFPASAIPVCLGTAAAVTVGGASFRLIYFVLALLAMMMLQGAANLLNDAYDYKLGLDTQVFPVSGAVVRKLLTPEQAVRGATLLFALGSLIGVVIAVACSWHVLWIGLIGLLVGIGYSYTSEGLKYRALGDFAVFADFGLLGALGAWTVQTGTPSWIPVLWAVPVGLHIIGILHANNWRDIGGDAGRGFATIASVIGDKGSLIYYALLLFLPYALVLCFVAVPEVFASVPPMPAGCLAVFLSILLALKLFATSMKRAGEGAQAFLALDGATAQLNMLFGLLLVAGFLLKLFIP